MEIHKGDKFKCIKDVRMKDDNRLEYTKGKIYTSEEDGCITNNSNTKYHFWSEEDGLKDYFTLISNDKKESVNHPSHYNQGGIECIDAMQSAFGSNAVSDFCICNAFKYIWRFKDKNGKEDIKKAIWYLNKVLFMIENEKI